MTIGTFLPVPARLALAATIVVAATIAGISVFSRTQVGKPPPSIEGTYQTSFTKAELLASPFLVQGEDNDGNWGDWTLVFTNGRVLYSQRNAVFQSSSSGTYTVQGDAVTMAFDAGSNHGETFVLRWALDGNTLSFRRDESLGAGPTPFLVKPWTRTQ